MKKSISGKDGIAAIFIFLAGVFANAYFFIYGKSVYHINSVASTTLYYIFLQLNNFQQLNFIPQYWSSHIYTGGPIHTGLGFYNPLLIAVSFFSKFSHALICYDIMLKFIAGFGVYLLLRAYDFSRRASLACSLIYPLNYYGAVFGPDPQFFGIISGLPWILLSLERLVVIVKARSSVFIKDADRKEWYKAGLHQSITLAFILALVYLASNIQSYTFLLSFVIFPYVILRLYVFAPSEEPSEENAGRKDAANLFVILVSIALFIALLLVLFEVVPTLTAMKSGDRVIGRFFWVRNILFAVLLLFSALFAKFIIRAKSRILYLVGSLLLISAFVFADRMPTLRHLFFSDYFEKFAETGFVFQAGLHFFTLCQLAVFTIGIWVSRRSAQNRLVPVYLAAGFFLLNILHPQDNAGLARYLYALYPDYYFRYSFIPLIGMMVAIAAGIEYIMFKLQTCKYQVAGLLILFILPFENYIVWQNKTLFTKGLEYLARSSPEYDFLRSMPALARVESVYNHEHERWKRSFYPSIFPGWLMPPYFGAHTFSRVGVGIIPRRNFEYNELALSEYFGIDGGKPLSPLLSLAGVKYIFSYDELAPNGNLKLLAKGTEYFIYENMRALPRIMLIPRVDRIEDNKMLAAMNMETEKGFLKHAYISDRSPSIVMKNSGENKIIRTSEDEFASNLGHVKIDRYDDEYVAIDCDIAEEAFLLITDTYYQGWKAFAGSRSLPIERADYIYRGIKLLPGHYTVVMSYSPDPERWARAISGSVLILAFIVWGSLGLGRKRLTF